jgi:hypothetical protein
MRQDPKIEVLKRLSAETNMTEDELLEEFGEGRHTVFVQSAEAMERQFRAFFGLTARTESHLSSRR